MNTQQQAWEAFFRTGSVTDYLSYCQHREEPVQQAVQGVGTVHEAEHRWDRPAGLQN